MIARLALCLALSGCLNYEPEPAMALSFSDAVLFVDTTAGTVRGRVVLIITNPVDDRAAGLSFALRAAGFLPGSGGEPIVHVPVVITAPELPTEIHDDARSIEVLIEAASNPIDAITIDGLCDRDGVIFDVALEQPALSAIELVEPHGCSWQLK